MITPRLIEFGIAANFEADHTVIAVRGDVDLLTAPTLQAALVSLVERGYLDIVLDLAGVTFMDASGLSVIADISSRLPASSHTLTLRAAPSMIHRILRITKLDKAVVFEDRVPDAGALRTQDLRFVHLGSRASTQLIDTALRRVTELVGATVHGADGVSITLERDGYLTTVAASNETVKRMDGHQYETGEGPCLSAAATGEGFHIESLADESRWPAFVPLALGQGIASILSTPLMTLERPLGALNIYSNIERAFGPQQQELAVLFASQASGILADSIAIDEAMDERLAVALFARQTIARAQGVLMEREGITADKAAASIHRSARAQGIDVARHAASIIASTHDGSPNA